MKIEKGVMVMKKGKAWGVTYQDGRSTSYGWISPFEAPIHNPEVCKRPEDVAYPGSPDVAELRTGKLVPVERRTEIAFPGCGFLIHPPADGLLLATLESVR